MNMIRRRALLAAGLMAGSFAGASVWRPRKRLADQWPKLELEAAFPKTFAGWQVDDRVPVQLISPDAQAVLDKIYNQTLSRNYVNRKGERIMLSVAYGGDQSDGTRAHRPEVCYPAQGFQITASRDVTMRLGAADLPVRQLVSRLGGRHEPISYWITVGERIALSGTDQKLAQLAYTLRGSVPDGMLVRVSSIDADAANAYRLQSMFILSMAEAVAPGVRSRIFGAS